MTLVSPLARRDALRVALLSLGAVGGASALAACARENDGRRGGTSGADVPVDGDVEMVASDTRRAAGDPSLVPEVVAGLQALAGGLYGGLAGEPGNLVLSPYSVLVALGMTLTGASGTTADEMRAVLGATGLGERWHKGVNALTAHIEGLAGTHERGDGSEAEIALGAANQLFGQHDVRWEGDFLDLLAKEYGASMRTVDYVGATERARTAINSWVEKQTAERIVDLVPEGALDPSTRLVLANAIYLKAPWETPFEKTMTAPGAFRAPGGEVQAEMMRLPDLRAGLVEGDGWRAAVLPYAGGGLAMSVVLPDEDRREDVERRAARDGFAAFTTGAVPAVLDLSLPRWSFRAEAGLKDLLADLGMPTAFAGADFTAMTEEDLDLVVDDVLHQGFIAVDEEGTEAAAATAVVMTETSAPVAVPFTVDRPFLYVIHDLEHGTPLFTGRVLDPTA